MTKSAQTYDPSEFQGYGQGGLAGYGQGGYDVGLENVGLVPGMDPQLPEKAHVPGLASPWAVPIGAAASGLIGIGLLRHLGRRLAGGAGRQIAQTGAVELPSNVTKLVQRYTPKQASLIGMLGFLSRR